MNRNYIVEYAFIGQMGAVVHRGARTLFLNGGTESEAEARVKQVLDGSWRKYGNNIAVVVTGMRPL